ncbi:MAG: hypothetical protein MHMPM18_000721 [Marteilia pararefringens]
MAKFKIDLSEMTYEKTSVSESEVGINTDPSLGLICFIRTLTSLMIIHLLTILADAYFGYRYFVSKDSNGRRQSKLYYDSLILSISILLSLFITFIYIEDIELQEYNPWIFWLAIKTFLILHQIIHYFTLLTYGIVLCKRCMKNDRNVHPDVPIPNTTPDSGYNTPLGNPRLAWWDQHAM